MDSLFIFFKYPNTISAIQSSEYMVFSAKIGFQTGNGWLAIIDY